MFSGSTPGLVGPVVPFLSILASSFSFHLPSPSSTASFQIFLLPSVLPCVIVLRRESPISMESIHFPCMPPAVCYGLNLLGYESLYWCVSYILLFMQCDLSLVFMLCDLSLVFMLCDLTRRCCSIVSDRSTSRWLDANHSDLSLLDVLLYSLLVLVFVGIQAISFFPKSQTDDWMIWQRSSMLDVAL